MSFIAKNLIVLLYLHICCLQDDSSIVGRVDGKNRFYAEGLLIYNAERET